ncbi:MAG: flagellar biosynthesis protein FlgB [Pseudomonadota bacterium]
MLTDLNIFKIYGAMARHATESQRITSINVSRSSEPGYRSLEVESFSEFFERAQKAGDLNQTFRVTEAKTPIAPNGNSVSLEKEIFASAEASAQHDMAMAVYGKTLDLMRAAMGRRN